MSRATYKGKVEALAAALDPHVVSASWVKDPVVESRKQKQLRLILFAPVMSSLKMLQKNNSFTSLKMKGALTKIVESRVWRRGLDDIAKWVKSHDIIIRKNCRAYHMAEKKAVPPKWLAKALAGPGVKRFVAANYMANRTEAPQAPVLEVADTEHDLSDEGEEEEEEEEDSAEQHRAEDDDALAFVRAEKPGQETEEPAEQHNEEPAENPYLYGWSSDKKAAWRSRMKNGRASKREWTKEVMVPDSDADPDAGVSVRFHDGHIGVVDEMPISLWKLREGKEVLPQASRSTKKGSKADTKTIEDEGFMKDGKRVVLKAKQIVTSCG